MYRYTIVASYKIGKDDIFPPITVKVKEITDECAINKVKQIAPNATVFLITEIEEI